ncbi:MAG: hypothetical protein ACOYNS_07630 [Bacteroidota bacterium]
MILSRNVATVLIMAVILPFSSCVNSGSGDVGSITSADFLGTNNARYRHTFSMIDSLGKTLDSFIDTITVTVSMEPKTIQGFTNSLKVEARSTPSVYNGKVIGSSSITHWYATRNDTVYQIAYSSGGGLFLPRTAQRSTGEFSADLSVPYSVQRYLRNQQRSADSIYIPELWRAVYSLPLYNGKQWFGYPPSYWFKQRKRVESTENISTAAGIFSCFKIRISINSDQFRPEEIWYDYVSKEGIILRTVQMTVNIATETNPDGVGRATFNERLELLSLN